MSTHQLLDWNFLKLAAYLLVLGCPIVGYKFAMRRPNPRHWTVMMWSAAGGAVAAAAMLSLLYLGDWIAPQMTDQTGKALAVFGTYSFFGLLFGFVGLVTRAKSTVRLVTTGAVLLWSFKLVRNWLDPNNPMISDDERASFRIFALALTCAVTGAIAVLAWTSRRAKKEHTS
jgi:hypothetical protein